MKLKNNFILLMACVTIITSSCVEPYSTPESKQDIDMLVVDGFLDANGGRVNVNLSKAINLSETKTPPVVSNAIVELEDSDHNVTTLTSPLAGYYSADGLFIDQAKQYRIRIKTGGKVYQSDFVSAKISPPIDDIAWVPSSDGVTITVGTHDDTGDSRYYLWTFDETYEYRSYYLSAYIFLGDTIVPRRPEEQIYNCWRTLPSTKILIGNSLRVHSDRIENKPIHFIPKGDIKISVKYSILVKQLVLSREAYDYYENLQKTTEQLGSLFDPQPGQVLGNIHRADGEKENVLGYFGAGQTTEKRMFFSYGDLPRHLRSPQVPDCQMDTVQIDELAQFDRSYYILTPVTEGPAVTGYAYSTRTCSDCRSQNGTTTKPSFWP